ncbi:hypothetical protein AMECASPLE_039740 [Ameca splendens]|uniref:Uncharacterized protein n=1 Tax=Ameca splendens TaxID=208324 RepID=A0ABV0Z6D2_9TELE
MTALMQHSLTVRPGTPPGGAACPPVTQQLPYSRRSSLERLEVVEVFNYSAPWCSIGLLNQIGLKNDDKRCNETNGEYYSSTTMVQNGSLIKLTNIFMVSEVMLVKLGSAG